MQKTKIAYIGGGSRGWAWGFMNDLALDPELTGTVRLYDIDREAAQANQIIGEKIARHPQAVSAWTYEVADSLQEALCDAEVVVISILPGTFREMRSDVHLPEEYGIYQSVGDTAGPGGLVRALRTIPMYVEIAQAIQAFAPQAWVINYTNPMAICMRTLYEVFPDIKAFGCCHEVFGTQKLLASMVEDDQLGEDVKRQDIKVNVVGVNHFTWLTQASYKNIDLFPYYEKFAEQYHAIGYTKGKDDNWMNNSFDSCQKVKFDLFRRYGSIAAAGDRHLVEFLPGSWYLKDSETVKSWGFGLTTVDFREKQLQERLEKSKGLKSGTIPVELKESGEEGHLLIKAVLGMGDLISNVNIPNRGQIPNLPLGTIVETNAFFSHDRVQALVAGDVPDNILPLIMPHALNQKLILQAALKCNFDLALQALLNEPNVALSPDQAAEMLRKMLKNTAKYLPDEWKIQ